MLNKPSTTATSILFTAVLLTGMFAGGVAAGLFFYPQIFAGGADTEGHHDQHNHQTEGEDAHAHDEGHVIALTEQAFANLDLKLGQVTRGDYWKSIVIPGQVVEIPGRSDMSVSAPVGGIVERVLVLPGQSLKPNQPLLELRVTDASLLDAESQLLATLTAQEVAEQEIARLEPLTREGVVGGGKKRDLEYELKQLQAKQTALIQEIRGRGLPEDLIRRVADEKKLATNLIVYAPAFVQFEDTQESTGYSIEDLHVHPGKAVIRGENLCSIAYHSNLYVEGKAFADDLEKLNRIAQKDWYVSIEQHQLDDEDEHDTDHPQVKLLRVDNHVDDVTQTVRFFARLPNSMTRSKTEGERTFEQWRFRPGQRLHLRLPIERWSNQITLPASAVVIDGPNVSVFVEHRHDHGSSSMDESDDVDVSEMANALIEELTSHHHHDEDVFIELEAVPVHLLHRDDETAVIADDGQLPDSCRVALNNARKLQLALQMQASGGGGHHHDHDH